MRTTRKMIEHREGAQIMARISLGSRIRQALGGRGAGAPKGTGGVDPRIGKQVLANDGTVLGTITATWRGTDATDHATHEDTLGVQRPGQTTETDLLYVPATAIASETPQSVSLTVGMAQVITRDWRFRPAWIAQNAPPAEGGSGPE